MDLVTFAPPLITGVLGFLSAWYLQGRNSRRVRLAHQVVIESLVRPDVPLEVNYAGSDLQLPQLVTATFRNLGPRDIEVADFEGGGIGLTVTGARIVAPLECTVGKDPINATVDDATGRIDVPPILIPRGQTIRIKILAAGQPADEATTIRLRQVTPVPWESQYRTPSQKVTVSLSIFGVGLAVLFFVQADRRLGAAGVPFDGLFPALLIAGVGVTVSCILSELLTRKR